MPRPGRTFVAIAFMAAAVGILNVALWVQYGHTRAALEAELGRRLEDVALTLGAVLDPGQIVAAWYAETDLVQPGTRNLGPDSVLTSTEAQLLRSRLREILDATDLANITLYDQDGHPFLDAVSTTGGALLRDPLYQAEVLAALRRSTAHTPLYRSGSEYLMSGYAPVQGATFALGVEADAKFFATLRRLGRSLLVVGAGSVGLLVALGLFHARVQSRLARAEAAVQHADTLASMGRMAAGIAHEIRNPLGIIRATASRLKKLHEDPAAPDERFDYIAEEVDRLSAVLDGYLGFARDEPSRLEPMDLVPLVERTLRLMQPELDGAGVRLEVVLPETCTLRGDAQRLRQVLMNLVLNAVQAMPAGGTLGLRLQLEEAQACLAVTDTGPGIPESLRTRVFEPFFTTKEKGSGLGLSVVRRIADEHGGRIVLGPGPEGGTRVEVRLPLG